MLVSVSVDVGGEVVVDVGVGVGVGVGCFSSDAVTTGSVRELVFERTVEGSVTDACGGREDEMSEVVDVLISDAELVDTIGKPRRDSESMGGKNNVSACCSWAKL